MKRLAALVVAGPLLMAALCQAQAAPAMTLTKMDEPKQKDWLAAGTSSSSAWPRMGPLRCERPGVC